MNCLDLNALHATPLIRQPFDFLVVPGFIRPEARASIQADYPEIKDTGSFPLTGLTYGPAFQSLIDALEGPEFRAVCEDKFSVNLSRSPTTITVRGRCGPKDGRIHTDSTSKILTVLIYMNASWEEPGGRLRLLRSPENIDDVILEIPPAEGTLLIFRRSNNSYHGHKPFVGPRRVIQFNWVTGRGSQRLAILRHRLSAPVKRLLSLVRPSRAKPVQAGAPEDGY